LEFSRHAEIDLHIHSNASDGSLSPTEILLRACRLGLKAIAITDHDTLDGSKTALHAGIPPTLKFLTGVEISAAPPPGTPVSGSLHILGYSIALDDPVLNRNLDMLQTVRKERNPRIIDKLNAMGFSLSLTELQSESGKRQIGRPHIAQAMVRKGYARNINHAFDEYLSTGKPAYVDKYRLDCENAIEMIRGAGGIAVLAHPYLIDSKDDTRIEKAVITLKEMGLQGVEVYYPQHTPENTAFYAKLAHRYHLLVTGGTDFHGTINPEIEMGSGTGDFRVPYRLYKEIIQETKPILYE
jgi:3',5'-nucleoside bisphosphate phosphatase